MIRHCLDCEKPISMRAMRCKSCASFYRWKIPREQWGNTKCCDCGCPLHAGAMRCWDCHVKRVGLDRNPSNHCLDCGIQITREAKRCRHCANNEPGRCAALSRFKKKQWKDKDFRNAVAETNRAIIKKMWNDPAYVSKVLTAQKVYPNRPEKIVMRMFPEEIRYVGDHSFWRRLENGKYKNPDFKVNNQDKVIEVWGHHWHKNENANDLINDYEKVGLGCLVIMEDELYGNPQETREKIINFIGSNP